MNAERFLFMKRRLLWMITENNRYFSLNPDNLEWKQGEKLGKDDWRSMFTLTFNDLSAEDKAAVVEYCLREGI